METDHRDHLGLAALVPLLTDGVVTLRAHHAEDVDAILEQCLDADAQRWTTVPRGYTREDAEGFTDRARAAWGDPRGNRLWAIEAVLDEDSGTPSYAGAVDLRPGEARTTASIGYALHPRARGAGVMARAVRLLAAHVFETGPWGTPVSRIHWRAIVGNWGSRRVAWATGFTFHGVVPESHVDPDDPERALDSWHASLGRDDALTPVAPWLEAVVIEGDGLRLRPWRAEDIDAIEERHDPEHWMPGRSTLGRDMFPAWLARRHELMAEASGVDWCVADTATDRALGGVTVFSRSGPLTGDVGELGYQLFPSARGRHVARRAAALAISHALAPRDRGGLGLRRLVSETAADNVASNRVLMANGFVSFGREHDVDPLPGAAWGDALYWERLTPPNRPGPGSGGGHPGLRSTGPG